MNAVGKERARRGVGVLAWGGNLGQLGTALLGKLAVWISGGRELKKDGTAIAGIHQQEYIWNCSRNIRKGSVAIAD